MKFFLVSFVVSSVSFGVQQIASAQGKGTTMDGKATPALINLATTGNPKSLQRMIGGQIMDSEALYMQARPVLDIMSEEHLAPKALMLDDGRMYAMVAPTITKDNFVYVEDGKLVRMDVGYTEGHNRPFIVEQIVSDGGASWWQELGHWFKNLFDR